MKNWAIAVLLVLAIPAATNAGIEVEWEASSGLYPDEIALPFTLVDEANPENPQLTVVDGTDVLRFSTDGLPTYERMFYSHLEIDVFFPFFVEAELKVLSGSTNKPNRATAMIAALAAPGKLWFLGIDPNDGVFLAGPGTSILDSATRDTNDGFHTYRIETDSAFNVRVFYDAESTPVLSATAWDPGASVLPGIHWGDISSNAEGTSDWKSFSHNAGVPEPSTLIIWSLLGGLAFTVGWWRRRRRK